MFDKLNAVESRYEELSVLLANPAVQSDATKYREHAKALSELEPVVDKYREYKRVAAQADGSRELIQSGDADMAALAKDELKELEPKLEALQGELKVLLLPRDPNDEKNVLLEIRAGTGGDEAALFAGELFRMYSRFAERQGWKMDVMTFSETGIGGIKEAIASIEGKRVYSQLKYESGVHRVQRVPATEASGRIHTSTATVAVLPEAEEVDIQVNEKDIRVDTFCSSGPGGQSVNTTYSAVRITHFPDRARRLSAGREVTDQEPREGDEGAAGAPVRNRDEQAAGGDGKGPPQPGRHRPALREDPHLQRPAEPHHRSPHQLHDAPARERAQRRSRRADRSRDVALHR